MRLPITSVVKPSTLYGTTNGQLPDSVLTRMPLDNGDSAVMERTAARAFTAMFAAARAAIPGLRIKDVGDYRSYRAQVNLFLSRHKPVSYARYLASRKRRYWPQARAMGYSSNYWVRYQGAAAAVPGTSNHGLGLALDVAQEYDGDSAPDPITDRFVRWLVANAYKYGISAELQSEPWHWRYHAGDAIPAAVLAYEGGTPPTQPPTNPPTTNTNETENIVNQLPTLRQGSKGTPVKRAQALLNVAGANTLVEDGDFGPLTHDIVRFFQGKSGLTPDGVVGAQTWAKLLGV